MSFACGYLGLGIEYFYSLTISEFHLISKGATKRIEDEQNMGLFNTRTIAYYSLSPHVKKLPSIEKFMPLPTDKKTVVKKHKWADLPEEELAKMFGD